MSKYLVVSYKPSSSYPQCSRGCCGYYEFESDFRTDSVETEKELEDVFYSIIYNNRKLQKGEDGFNTYVYVNNIQRLVAGEYNDCAFSDDGFEYLENIYTIAKDRVAKDIAEAEEKAKFEKIQKEAKAAEEQKRMKEETEKALLKELQDKYGNKQ